MIGKTKTGWSGMFAAGGIIVAAGLALGCTDTPNGLPPTYTVGGTVSGLAGSGLMLRNNGGDDLRVSANGSFAFATELAGGAAYSITVFAQPSSPAQRCAVTGGSGTMASTNVTTVAIVCFTNAYTVGGTVSGLVGSGLVLRNNGGDDLPVSANGPVTFATPLASGTAYNITVFAQPTGSAQTCVVTGGSGTMANANVTTVAIACGTNAYTVGGTVSGLVGSGLVLRNNGDDVLPVSGNGPVTFATPLSTGATYSVTVLDQPMTPDQTCVVTGGSGTMGTAKVTTVAIACVTNAGTGAVRVKLFTAGLDAPATDTVHFDGQSGSDSTAAVPANGAVSFDVAPGAHAVSLTVAPNCTSTSPNPVTVTVTSGATIDIGFSVTCVAAGTLQVTAATTGPDAPATFLVGVDQGVGSYTAVPANGTGSIILPQGEHTATLVVPGNCAVTTPNDLSVLVARGATTNIGFSVTCVANGTLRVTVATTGADIPATYRVEIDPSFTYTYLTIPANGTISRTVSPGQHAVRLVVSQGNCRVSGSSSASVTVMSGATTDIAFAVICGNGTLRVTVATTGPRAPATYTVGVDPDFYGFYTHSAVISTNGTVSQILTQGQHIVNLLVPLNCTVTSPNNVSVSLTSGATTDLGFTVACH